MVSTGESQAEWTASRCFRLLRPIVSRKSTLGSRHAPESQRSDARARIAPTASRPRFGDSPNPRLDPDWMVKPRKLAPRQYAKLAPLSSSEAVTEHSAGSLSIPTPVIARIRGVEASNQPYASSLRNAQSNGRDIFSEKFISQSDELNFRSQKLVRGTLDLVEATNSCQSEDAQESFFPSVGPKSLRAMCCRRYARHIVALEDEQETQNTEEKFDIATEAYALVEETFDVGAGDYLRAIAREQGVALFEKMLIDSRIPRSHALALVRRMRTPQRSRFKHSSVAEVDSMSEVLLRANPPDKPCCNRNNTYGHVFNSLAELSSLCDDDSMVGFEFRRVRDLVDSVMPVCWFGSRRVTALWTNAFRAFADPARTLHDQITAVRDVSRFLDLFVALDCGIKQVSKPAVYLMNSSAIPDYYGNASGCPKCPRVPAYARFLNVPTSQQPHTAANNHMSRKRLDTSLNNSFSSLFAILASFSITKRIHPEQLSSVEPDAIQRVLGCLSMDLLLASTSANGIDEEFPFERGSSILGSTLLTLVATELPNDAGSPNISINDLVRGLEVIDRRARLNEEYRRSTLETLPDLIFSTVRSSGKLLKSDGFNVLAYIASSLTSETLSAHATSASCLFLEELAVSSVQLFAERTGSEEALKLATQLQRQFSGKGSYNALATPFKSTPRPGRDREGLKWEDSICEWVSATPAVGNHALEVTNRVVARAQEQNAKWIYPTYMDITDEIAIDNTNLLSPASSTTSSDGARQLLAPPQDTTLSTLLLSPETLASSSPAYTHNVKKTVPDAENHLRSALNKATGKKTITLVKTRKPLATLTNITDTRMSSAVAKNQKPATRNERLTYPKRTFADSSGDSSDDELSLPRKRIHVPSKAQAPPLQDSDMGAEDDEDLACESEETSFTAKRRSRVNLTASRRNPRGKILRSLPNKQGKPPLQTRRSDHFSSGADGEDSDDELSFEAESTAVGGTRNRTR